MNTAQDIIHKLHDAGLKTTPQRIAIMQTLFRLRQHPTADELYVEVSKQLPGLSPTTIYNTLETFVEKGMIKRIKTDAGVMRYDDIIESHHHMYCSFSDRIEDYFDPELDELLKDYFEKKKIEGFTVNDIRLQLMGDFQTKKNKTNKK